MSGPPTLFLLVGLPGSGKTTLARQLEAERRALRLTPDEWMHPLFGAGESDGKRWVLESELLWGIAARALTLGLDVVLDYGCWSRQERTLFRDRTLELGARFELRVLDPPLDELWRRLAARNASLPPAAFAVTREELERWNAGFERPGEDERRP